MNDAANNARTIRLPGVLCWAGLLVMLCVAALRMVTAFNHIIVFDVDPAIDPNRFAGLASESLWLDVLLLVGASIAMLGHVLVGRVLNWWLYVLAILPMVVVFLHGYDDLGDLRKGATWAAAAVVGVTIAHLRADPAMRIVIIMVIAGILAPLLVRGAANMTYEYEDTLAHYQQQKDMILADKGWTEGSSSERIYRRRLEQREPTGWFATTNIFGSFMGAGLVLWLGLAFAAWRARLTSGWIGLAVIFTALCSAGLCFTTSKGAFLSALAGIGVLCVFLIATQMAGGVSTLIRSIVPLVGVGLVVAALCGIMVRGAILPESFSGEVSLLYRWHYMISAVQIFLENMLLGVGPDEFQAQYMMHRLARNPEEVASAHSMFFDWLAALGIMSVAWIGLVFSMLWRAGRYVSQPKDTEQRNATGISPAGALGAILCVAVCGVALAVIWEWHILDALGLTVRAAGIAGCVVMALAAGHVAAHCSRRIVDIAMVGSAVVLVVHGQIEMTWMQPGSVVMAWVMLGAASPIGGRSSRPIGALLVIVVLGAAIWLAVSGAMPAMRMQGRMVDAARLLAPAAEARQAQFIIEMQRHQNPGSDVQQFVNTRNTALQELGIETQPEALTGRQLEKLLVPALVQRRLQAAEILEDAYHQWPESEDCLSLASRQLGLASEQMTMPQRIDVLLRSTAVAEQSAELYNDVASASLAVLMRQKLHELTGDHSHIDKAIELAEYLTTRDPKGIRAWVSLGNVLWADGQRDRAAEAYRNALQHSDNFELDPDKQLEHEMRTLLESRVFQSPGGD